MTQTQTAQRLINVIIVNPNDNSITNAVINKDNGLKDYYAFMECDTFDMVSYNETNDVYVDDNGLMNLTPATRFFSWEGSAQPYAGIGIFAGYDDETGDTISTTLTIDELKPKIRFHSLADVRMMF